ncbi:hypothetical protein SY27_01345 [Flavobacterium sp. 316]|uniref:hypothetical protein n=1 Tax=Flavobacterium sp. 316 TaxID=1603293 RepID=UPI0005E2D253|nr:hypothetical protein [Flavobacterium sp. 316]KIX22513.1 hypothetical protein SY27_01345 [Flavobacterium sp. 316]
MENKENLNDIIKGLTGYVSKPFKYTVSYFNGEQTYTEKFVVLTIGKEFTGNTSKGLDVIIDQVSTALGAAVGTATGGLGLALGPLTNIALHWIKDQIFNADGTITIMLANHYIGTKNGGIDPTFWPGGLETAHWEGIVNSIMVALNALGSKFDGKEELTHSENITVQGNYSEETNIPAVERVKEYFSNQEIFTRESISVNNFSNQNFYKMGLPTLVNNKGFETFLNESLGQMSISSSNVSTYGLSCLACKSVAYATAGVLVVMSAVALAEIAVTSSIVGSLASALGISPALALQCIRVAVNSIAFGASVVANEICSAAGFC